MRSTEARSAEIERPDGVTRSFQVSENNVEPSKAVRARNLLTKDERRAALADETEPCGPEVSLVVESSALAGIAKWLAGTGSCPYRHIIGDASETQRQ